jgi:hypothetical protein
MSSNLPLKKNWGPSTDKTSPQLLRALDEMYTDIALSLQPLVKKNILNGANPAATDQRNTYFSIGDIAVRTDTNAVWVMTSRTTPETVTWTAV